MLIIKIIFSIIISYFIGNFSGSILLSRFVYGRDIRTCGSGNAGATNMARSFGLKMGVITLVCDTLKTVIAILIGKVLLNEQGLCLAGIACLTGHCYPALYGFKGGKGVSVCAAAIWFIDWRVGAAALAVFILTALWSRKVSFGSLCAAAVVSAAALIISPPLPKLFLAFFCSILIILRHRENIARLMAGTEPDFKSKK